MARVRHPAPHREALVKCQFLRGNDLAPAPHNTAVLDHRVQGVRCARIHRVLAPALIELQDVVRRQAQLGRVALQVLILSGRQDCLPRVRHCLDLLHTLSQRPACWPPTSPAQVVVVFFFCGHEDGVEGQRLLIAKLDNWKV
jgi:hypothetical protein